MKKIIMTIAAFALWGISAQAQVKIGDNPTTVGASSLLELESTNKGLVLPRMTTTQRTAIASPVAGMQVYDTTTGTIWLRNASIWVNTGATTTTVSNTITGNTLTTTVNGVTGTGVTLPSSGISTTLASGNMLVGNASNTATAVTMSGDATLSNAGALTIGTDKVTTVKIIDGAVTSAKILDGTVANADLATGAGGIYKGSGSLSGATTIAQAANTLALTGTAVNAFSVDGTTLSVDAANNRVGIGTAAPTTALDVVGSVKISGGSPGLGKVLTSDAAGLASWSTPASSWGLTGNAGTVETTNFIGTTDEKALIFKVNGVRAGYISAYTTNSAATTFGQGTFSNYNYARRVTAIGYNSLHSLGGPTLWEGPYSNTAVGHSSAENLTIGQYNTAVGDKALFGMTTGWGSTAIGTAAGEKGTGGFNTYVGRLADAIDDGNYTYSTAIGSEAKFSASNSMILGGTGAAAVSVGVGVTAPNASSLLDLTSTTKGFLMPRMTTILRTAIATPAAGLQVYDTDTKSIWVYNGAAWGNTLSSVLPVHPDNATAGTNGVAVGSFYRTSTGVLMVRY